MKIMDWRNLKEKKHTKIYRKENRKKGGKYLKNTSDAKRKNQKE